LLISPKSFTDDFVKYTETPSLVIVLMSRVLLSHIWAMEFDRETFNWPLNWPLSAFRFNIMSLCDSQKAKIGANQLNREIFKNPLQIGILFFRHQKTYTSSSALKIPMQCLFVLRNLYLVIE
jgi:hypothetical protein